MTRKMKDSGIEWIGEIPEEWSSGKLKKYVYFKTGGTPSTKNQEVFEGEFKWFTPGDLNESLILKDSFRHLNKHYVKENIVPIYPPSSVLIVGIGATIGKLGFTTEESSSNQQITAIMSKEHIDSKFLLYMMLASVDVIKETALFTTLPILNNQTLGETLILSLPKKEQIKIAKYLDNKCTKIDETIEKQKQVIEKLKEYKQSIITEAVTRGLNPKAPMKDSGVEWIGEIPENWEIRKLKSIVKTTKGYAFKVDMFSDSGIPVVKASDLKKQTVIKSGLFINSEVANNYLNFKLSTNDILMSTVGSAPDVTNSAVGQLALVPRELDGSLLNQNVVRLITNKKVNNLFLFYYLYTHAFRKYLDLIAHGTANQASLTLKDILDYNSPLPNLKEQKAIADYLDKKCALIDKSITQKEKLIEKLIEYKKSLIYECVTGKREV